VRACRQLLPPVLATTACVVVRTRGSGVESQKFDALVRRMEIGTSRRASVRVGLGAAMLSAVVGRDFGLFDEAAAGKRHRHKNKKPKKCKGSAPVKCGSGCCTSGYPLCCPDALTHDSLCFPSGAVCCPLDQGGGACPPKSTCCPSGSSAAYGGCATAGVSVCCDANHGGGSCPADASVCCLDAVSNNDNHGCCPNNSACCNVTADCAALPGTVCDSGCCVV
jgi:hypothetical protein